MKKYTEVQNLYHSKMASEKPLLVGFIDKIHILLLYLTENFLLWTEKGLMGEEIRTCIVDRYM